MEVLIGQGPKVSSSNFLINHRSKPLQIWDKQVRNGHIKRITDPDIQSSVLEIMGTNVSTNYINAPLDPKKTLAIKLPFLVMIIKNLKKYFTFEVQVLDDKSVRRRFRASNYQTNSSSIAQIAENGLGEGDLVCLDFDESFGHFFLNRYS